MAQWSALLTAVAGVISAVIWPVVVIGIAWMFKRPLSTLLRTDDVSLSGPDGLTLTARHRVTQAADALVDASKIKDGEQLSRRNAVAEAADTQEQLRGIRDPVVLWVDDTPSNNRHERAAMEALGITFVLSTSTDDALAKIGQRTFGAIISDMGRPPDAKAGYTLLDEIRRRGIQTPVVIYASSRAPDHFDEAVAHGAVGCTNRTSELVHMVVSALKTNRVG
jgi:CheY-like chemotaxis protein